MEAEGQRLRSFARTNARRPFRVFGIKETDRFSHMYVIGKTGVGKTTLLETLILADIAAGNGCALIVRRDNQDERAASIRMRMRRGCTDGGRA